MRTFLTVLFVALALPAQAAIAVNTTGNNGADNGGVTTSVSWSFDAVGAGCVDCALLVQVESDVTVDDVTVCTYNSVPMIFQNKAHAGTTGRWTYAYGLLDPDGGGAHTIQCTASSAHYLFGVAVSYSGVATFGATSSQTATGVSTIAGNIVVTQANSWVYAGVSSSNTAGWSGVVNATARGQYDPFDSPQLFDNNAAVASGAYSMTVSGGANGDMGMVMVELTVVGGGGGPTSSGLLLRGVGGPFAPDEPDFIPAPMEPPPAEDGILDDSAFLFTPLFTQLTVCASGCPYTNAQMQDALYTAVPGDEVLLESGHEYTAIDEGHVLGAQCKSAPTWDCIILRTGVTATGEVMSLSSFPPAGTRMDTSYRGTLAKLVPQYNNQPSLRTIYPGETGPTCAAQPCPGSGWTVKWIEFAPKVDYAQRHLVRFGSNNAGREWNGSCATWPDSTPSCWNTTLPNAQTQDTLVEIPQYLSFIQNDIHGDSFVGQSGGLLLATKDARVKDNSFTDFKSLIETQALTALNGIGPYDVQNNLFEATGENTMWGGDDPYLILQATLSGTPTTTVVALASPVWWSRIDHSTTAANLTTDIYSTIFVSITHAGTRYTGMECALSAVTSSTATCTLSPAMPVTPSAGDIVQWDWIHGGVTFKYNYVRKPIEWFGDILAKPTGVTATAVSGGTLVAGTYCYRVMWFAFVSGAGPDVQSEASTESCAVVNGTTNRSVRIDWPGDAHATRYWVYGRATGAQTMAWEVAAGVVTYTDTGTAGASEAPLAHGHNWTVKNLHEWKNCDGESPMGPCLVEGNVFERSWCCTQSNGISVKVNNQLGDDVSSTVRGFTYRNNWGRHMNRALAISCSNADTYGGGTASNITVTGNLWTDSSNAWVYPPGGSANSIIYIGAGQHVNNAGPLGCVGLSITHNSFFVATDDMNGPLWFNANDAGDTMVDLVLRDNIMGRDCSSGSCDSNSTHSLKAFFPGNTAEGTTSWTAATSGSSVADHNAWPGGGSGTYTAPPFTTPFFIADATLKSTHLMNYTACDNDSDILGCVVTSGSTMHLAGSDAADVGANIAAIKAFTDIALSGNTGSEAAVGVGRPRTRLRTR